MEKFGKTLGGLIGLMVLLTCLTVIAKSLFDYVSIPLQELTLYLHSVAFMLGMVYAWHHNRHVRVDVIYAQQTAESKRKIDLMGHLVLALPFCVFLLYVCTPYVIRSWQGWEASANTGGLPVIWLIKSFLVLMPLSMLCLILFKIFKQRNSD